MCLLPSLMILAVLAAGPAPAGVVINEILYHAPDDLDDLQFIELHNAGRTAVDLSGWKLARSVRYEFGKGARIEAGGFVVVCKDQKLFKRYYGFEAAGVFAGALGRGDGRIELLDAGGKPVDDVRYRSRPPWPLAADGYSSSLERICPNAPGDKPENWASSPLPVVTRKPVGTPGRPNANYAASLPPVVSHLTFTPAHAAPGQEIAVEAEVRPAEELRTVELRYRIAGSGFEKVEAALPMTKTPQGRYAAKIPGQNAGQIVRFRVRAVDAAGAERFYPDANELRPAQSVYVHEPFHPGKIPFGFILNVGRPPQGGGGYAPPSPEPPPRGNSAFVFVSPKTGVPELFDFVNITPRGGGHKVRFHKDHALDGMTTINLIFEGMDRFVLAEPLAYEVYRKAGNAACRTDFVRTWVDGRPEGYRLLIEQPNKSFLRHNGLRTDGNLYKVQWFGNNLIAQHEKKTHPHEGHDDIVSIVRELGATRRDEQWSVIKKNFDVEQVINYFAVNMVLSHWDGYFNNHFVYHDTRGTGKWTMYPWDQDKTWGFHDGIRGYEVFTDMPLTFGMWGDVPRGVVWWRPAGHFSGPLLANPRLRPLFLARTKEILEKVYTEDVFFPLLQALGERLEDEVKERARLQGQDPQQAVQHLRRNLDSLREHLTKRRKFLLAQDALKKAGPFDRSGLK